MAAAGAEYPAAVRLPAVRPGVDIILPLGPHHADRGIHQIADHGFRVPPHVTHLGELRGFDLDERRAREPSQPAGDLGLPHPGRADEDDVVGGDLVPDGLRRLGPAPAIPDGDRDRALRGLLPHDVAIQLRHDLRGGSSSSQGGWGGGSSAWGMGSTSVMRVSSYRLLAVSC